MQAGDGEDMRNAAPPDFFEDPGVHAVGIAREQRIGGERFGGTHVRSEAVV